MGNTVSKSFQHHNIKCLDSKENFSEKSSSTWSELFSKCLQTPPMTRAEYQVDQEPEVKLPNQIDTKQGLAPLDRREWEPPAWGRKAQQGRFISVETAPTTHEYHLVYTLNRVRGGLVKSTMTMTTTTTTTAWWLRIGRSAHGLCQNQKEIKFTCISPKIFTKK